MSVRAITSDYHFPARDMQSHYGDNILIYIGWDEHTLFCSAKAFTISPDATFQQLLDQLMPAGFSQHPDFQHIDWTQVIFNLDGQKLPAYSEQALCAQSLTALGFGHKSLLRFKTPGLNGYLGTHV